jgi:3-phosphoglycerate kinase
LIVSHIETKDVEKPSLKPVFEYLQKNYPEFKIIFSENIKDFENIKDGEFLLLENIRNFSGEKENDLILICSDMEMKLFKIVVYGHFISNNSKFISE